MKIINENKKKNLDYIRELEKHKTKCECGHTITLMYKSYVICNWCGRKVYRSEKDEFNDKLKKVFK